MKAIKGLIIIVMFAITTYTALAYNTPVPLASWNLDNNSGSVNTSSYLGLTDLTLTGSVTVDSTDIPAGLYEAADFPASGYFNVTNESTFDFVNGDNWSVELWIRPEAIGNYYTITSKGASYGTFEVTFLVQILNAASGNKLNFCTYGGCGGGNEIQSSTAIVANKIHHLVLTHNSTGASGNSTIYINGSSDATGTTVSPILRSGSQMTIGIRDDIAQAFDGDILYMAIYNKTLSAAEVLGLYTGKTQYSTAVTPGVPYWKVDVTDRYDDLAEENVNVTFGDPACWNETNVLGIATVTNESAACAWKGTIDYNFSKSGFYGGSGTVDENATSNENISAGRTSINSVKEAVTETVLTEYINWSVLSSGGKAYNGTAGSYPTQIYLTNGSNNLTLKYHGSNDYYPITKEVNLTAPDILISSFLNVSNCHLNIYAKNITGNAISNYTVNVSQTTYAYEFSKSTTNASLQLNLTQGLNYSVIVDAGEDYSLGNTTIECNAAIVNKNFTLPPPNVNITFYNERTLANMNGVDVTVSFIGASNVSYVTNDSTLELIGTLNPGNYTIRYEAVNWSTRDYYLAVTPQGNYSLKLYMIEQAESNLLPVTIVNLQTVPQPDVIVHWKRWIGNLSSYEVVEMATSDEGGTLTLYFDEYDAWYKAEILVNGVIVRSVDAVRYTPTDATSGIIWSIDITEDAFESLIPSNALFSSTGLAYNNNTRTFSYTYADTSGILTQMCLYVYEKYRRTTTLINSTCSTSSSSTLVATHNATNNTIVGKVYYETNTANSDYWLAILEVMPVGAARTLLLQYAPFLGGLFIATLGLISGANPIIPIGFAILGLLGFGVSGFLDFTMQTIMTVAIIGLGIVMLLGWRKTS